MFVAKEFVNMGFGLWRKRLERNNGDEYRRRSDMEIQKLVEITEKMSVTQDLMARTLDKQTSLLEMGLQRQVKVADKVDLIFQRTFQGQGGGG